MNWTIKTIDNSEGSFLTNGCSCHIHAEIETPLETVEITSTRGKFSDSEDSFLYCYIDVDPRKENFKASAAFEVLESEGIPSRQTGYGILVADTPYSDDVATGDMQIQKPFAHWLLSNKRKKRSRIRIARGRRLYESRYVAI